MRVLFKEDDDLVAHTLERQLRKLGHASERIIDVNQLLKHETELEPDVCPSSEHLAQVAA